MELNGIKKEFCVSRWFVGKAVEITFVVKDT